MHHFNGEKVDFVCSNGAPEIKGLHDIDECIEAQTFGISATAQDKIRNQQLNLTMFQMIKIKK
ncbi:hypothetical protein DAPK24_030230 [Pichia kluyveri]|uniref:Uncharacterized protein n=1 Tax=Pichia kluyveri TaxID=36015 RepID=A0AAV5R5H4_PICKL|nr:hypothetical protein DAPK24_030230 [Pichia kluyveri]